KHNKTLTTLLTFSLTTPSITHYITLSLHYALPILTYDGSIARLYVNGVLKDSRVYTVSLPDGNMFHVGEGVSGNRWNGLIDEARLLDHTFKVAERYELVLCLLTSCIMSFGLDTLT